MLKFYFNGSPNPTKVALFLEEAGLALRGDSHRYPQGRPVQAGVPGGQPERQGAGHRRRRHDRVRQQRHPALPGREDRQVPAQAGRARRAALLADVRGHRASVRSRARRCTSSITRRRKSPTRTTATSSRPCATTASSTTAWPSTSTWSATPTRSSTWTCGAGRAWCPSSWATTRGPSCRTSSGWSTRSTPGRRRREANGLKDKFKFKAEMDDEARAQHVPPPQDGCGLIAIGRGFASSCVEGNAFVIGGGKGVQIPLNQL